jgi:hypothetical protein
MVWGPSIFSRSIFCHREHLLSQIAIARRVAFCDNIKKKSKEAGSKANAEVRGGLAEVREKRGALKKELKKLRKAGIREWEHARKKVDAAEKELEAAYDRAMSGFRSE